MATFILILLVVGALFWIFKLFNDGTIGNVGRLLGVLMVLIGAGSFFLWNILSNITSAG